MLLGHLVNASRASSASVRGKPRPDARVARARRLRPVWLGELRRRAGHRRWVDGDQLAGLPFELVRRCHGVLAGAVEFDLSLDAVERALMQRFIVLKSGQAVVLGKGL